MGLGDVLMSIGEAKRLHRRTGAPVQIVGRDGKPVVSSLFNGLPYIVQNPGSGVEVRRMVNGSGVRPYIVSKASQKWTWQAYSPVPGEIAFTDEERAFAEPYRGLVMLEPHVKAVGHSNKDWGPINWQQLDSLLNSKRIAAVQCGPSGTRPLLHTKFVTTDSFRKAAAVLSVCRAYVGPEGGLHHAAAAVGVPAVVIYGGFISPAVTGYKSQVNLFTGSGLGCGMRSECRHCRDAMGKIKPRAVFDALMGVLG